MQEAYIRATMAESRRPGIAEQYQLRFDKLRANVASLEVLSMPRALVCSPPLRTASV